ncbi:MAG: P1 family peptidase [Clostridia bacterium]|nr:P1 family peptidase [Clostridia bacterium]
MDNRFVLPQGIKIGHADDGCTGVTCILTDNAVGGVSVRGGAPGTRETDMLRADKSQGFVNAIVLSGGSAYGLEAACGVTEYLRERGVGFAVGDKVVPLVAQAILYDLNTPGEYRYPDKKMGYAAAKNAGANNIKFGAVGAGTGATVGKILGVVASSRGGIGGATLHFGDVFVSAVVAVNALGDVYDHKTGKIIAGARTADGKFLNTVECLTNGFFAAQMRDRAGTNTTIGCVMTNARLDKAGANRLADVAHDGLALSIRPVHTDADGDTLFALSAGDKEADGSVLAALAVETVALAVENAVRIK